MADEGKEKTPLQQSLEKTKREGVPSAGKKNWDDLKAAAAYGVKKAGAKAEKEQEKEEASE